MPPSRSNVGRAPLLGDHYGRLADSPKPSQVLDTEDAPAGDVWRSRPTDEAEVGGEARVDCWAGACPAELPPRGLLVERSCRLRRWAAAVHRGRTRRR